MDRLLRQFVITSSLLSSSRKTGPITSSEASPPLIGAMWPLYLRCGEFMYMFRFIHAVLQGDPYTSSVCPAGGCPELLGRSVGSFFGLVGSFFFYFLVAPGREVGHTIGAVLGGRGPPETLLKTETMHHWGAYRSPQDPPGPGSAFILWVFKL